MESAGWYVFRTPMIYIKPNSGRVPLPDQGPRRQWEAILYAIKGKKPVTNIYPDVLYSTADEQLSHGAQKTVSGFKNLLQRSVRPGDVVLDCFAGTGTIIPAAHAFKCRAICIEQEKEYFATCVQRIEKLKEV
jgi:DNA modification methylase